MFLINLVLYAQFSTGYKEFIRSPQSESIFVNLVRGNKQLSDYADDPVVLWYWRSNTGSAEADSLLGRTNIPRNKYLGAVLRWEAKETSDPRHRFEKMKLAVHFDPVSIENFVSLLTLAIQTRDLRPLTLAFSMPIHSDFSNQVLFISNLLLLLFTAAFLSGFIYIMVKMIYYLPALSHRLIAIKHNPLVDVVKMLIILAPAIMLRNAYLVYLMYGILLIPVLNGREKNWLRVNILGILLLFIASMPANNLFSFLSDYGPEYQYYELVNHDAFREIGASDTREKEIYAYALKKQAKLESAFELYEALYYGGHRNTAVTNNLANIYFEYEEYALAESLYKNAFSHDENPVPYFNLGLLKLHLIEYSESSRYMEEARNRGFSSDSRKPIDLAPTNKDFYRWIMGQELKTEGKINTLLIIPFLILLFMSFAPVKIPPPYYCNSCGRPVCSTCVKEIENDTICEQCFSKFKSTKRQEIEADLRQAVSMNRQRLNNVVRFLLNLIIPGGGLVFMKKHFSGLVCIFLALIGYVPLLMPGIFVKPAGWIVLPFESIFLLSAAVILLASYLISFTMMKE